MGEISTLQVVLMGLITVFVVLICLIVIIKLLGMIVAKVTPTKAAAPAVAAAPAAAPAPAAPSANKQQIVAAIAVAIAEEMGTDVSHIRIHSIKRV
ncbi:OadG family protein [Anaeromassilibacillus senegalensis]|uniref:OadG family protein n=1 Tax=Anaeromassilibacillus senegalensis TaxID=1673717 RepID=A0ABS9CMC2_9FIRM|nr:OadG family protein [Anaeromassilibacillus senegalensis]MCF2651481.1 OadG family protein [Anaeromassilibacillus senegalensis]